MHKNVTGDTVEDPLNGLIWPCFVQYEAHYDPQHRVWVSLVVHRIPREVLLNVAYESCQFSVIGLGQVESGSHFEVCGQIDSVSQLFHDAFTHSCTSGHLVESKQKFFRVREFQFLFGKICVAHSVTHSFTFLLCCALSVRVEIPPAGPRRYSKYRRSSSHKSPQ